MSDIQRAMVLGSGTMGAGIAEVLAVHGIEVTLYDLDAAILAKGRGRLEASLAKAVDKQKLSPEAAAAAKARLSYGTDEGAVANVDLLIEAIPENLELKKQTFARLGAKNERALFGTNTSSLSVGSIAAATPRPERVIGLHFFNPPPVMPLLEIVRAAPTSSETVERARALATRLGKTSILVKDVPGFATSRLGVALGLEAIRMLEDGVASAEDIDRAMELGYRHPMGPLKLTDLVGLDVRLAIAEHLSKEIGPQFTPPRLLVDLVKSGKTGQKAGEGFYRWQDGKAVAK